MIEFPLLVSIFREEGPSRKSNGESLCQYVITLFLAASAAQEGLPSLCPSVRNHTLIS